MHSSHITNLDIIKVIAAFFIVFHHFQQCTGLVTGGINFYGGNYDWSLMVELFFMISGYLAVRNMKKNGEMTAKDLARKYVGYVVLAFPSILSCLAVEYALYRASGGAYGHTYDIFKTIRSFLLIDNGFYYSGKSINNPTWFISMLLIYQIMFYAAGRVNHMLGGGKMPYIIFAVFVLYFVLGYGLKFLSDMYYLPFFNFQVYRGAAPFFCGCMLFYLFEFTAEKRWVLRVILMTAMVWRISTVGFDMFVSVYMLFPLLIDLAVNTRGLTGKVFRDMSGVSMNMFLWHMPFIDCLFVYVFAVNADITVETMIILSAAVFVFSIVWTKIYSVPLNKYIKRIFEDRAKKVKEDISK